LSKIENLTFQYLTKQQASLITRTWPWCLLPPVSAHAGKDGKQQQWQRKWRRQQKPLRHSGGNRGSGGGSNGSKTETSAAEPVLAEVAIKETVVLEVAEADTLQHWLRRGQATINTTAMAVLMAVAVNNQQNGSGSVDSGRSDNDGSDDGGCSGIDGCGGGRCGGDGGGGGGNNNSDSDDGGSGGSGGWGSGDKDNNISNAAVAAATTEAAAVAMAVAMAMAAMAMAPPTATALVRATATAMAAAATETASWSGCRHCHQPMYMNVRQSLRRTQVPRGWIRQHLADFGKCWQVSVEKSPQIQKQVWQETRIFTCGFW
jgi:hypothetical protein